MQIFYHHPAPSKQKPVPTVMAVKHHRPWLCPTLLFTIIITVIVGGLYLWNYSVKEMRQDRQNFVEQYLRDNPPVKPITDNTKELQSKLETVVSTAEDLAQSLTKLQQQHLDVTEELEFYKKLTTTSRTKSKVTVNSFALHKVADKYVYKLVLTKQSGKIATGVVQINLTGKLNGKNKQLNMVTITEDSIPAINYKIKYFERFIGEIKLPKNFIPEHLIIHLAANSRQVAEKINFTWEELQPKE